MKQSPFFPWLSALFLACSLAFSAEQATAATPAEARADFLKLIDRPRVPLAPEVQPAAAANKDGLVEISFSYASEAAQRVPGILVKPAAAHGRLPVVIALHGTGGKKETILPLLRTLARRGFAAVAIDGRWHGERAKPATSAVAYQDAILRAWHAGEEPHEHPFFFDTVWDVMRLNDWLATRDDVDASRTGLYGVSKGGIETYLAAAADPRIAVAVPCIGLESFRWALEHDSWQSRIGTIQNAFDTAAKEAGVTAPGADFVKKFYARVAPGIDGEFDGPAMVVAIAPRPLLTINGDSDARTPLPGLKECTDAAQTAYHAAGADDHFVVRIQEKTGHRVNPDSEHVAVEWFVRWLQPTP